MDIPADKPLVFIGSSTKGLPVAQAIQTKLQDHAWARVWNEDVIGLMDGTLEGLLRAAGEFDFGVFVFTPDDLLVSREVAYDAVRDNVLFECGLWMGSIGRDRTLVVRADRPELKIPSDLLGVTFATYDGENRSREQLLTALGPACTKLITRIEKAKKRKPAGAAGDDIESSLRRIVEGAERVKTYSDFSRNVLLQEVIRKSLQQVATRLGRVSYGYTVSASQYPDYLIALQASDLNPLVRAVALVDQEERFWQLEPGLKILRTSSEKNQRVFVFSKAEDLSRNLYTLLEHDQKYQVKLMSADKLKAFHPYNKDFSIIQSGESRLVAFYDEKQSTKPICFSADRDEVAKHERSFSALFWHGVSMKEIFEAADVKELSENAEAKAQQMEKLHKAAGQIVFGEALRQLERRPVEMSGYISVDDYDEHEEEHAYFTRMMGRMIEIFAAHRGDPTRTCRVLEFGAGTGIFTRRLAMQPNVEVTAMEIDWACFRKLESNLKKHKLTNVRPLNKDSRRYDPDDEDGRFDFVFSSFADHHIRDNVDKVKYLENVRQNLNPGGLFIVGDEFLPAHDRKNPEERERALHAYHDHIIEAARREGHEVLVMLEQEALQSGLNERGDFKLSCKQYEKIVNDAGLTLRYKPEKIGPERDDIGGVYVYTWALRD